MRLNRPALPRLSPPPGAVRTAAATRRGVDRLSRAMTLPVLRILEQTVAMVEVRATTAFVELGVPDVLANGPKSSAAIAAELRVDESRLDRLLLFLATRGIVRRVGEQFGLTATSDLLRTDHPDSLRDWVLFQGSAWQWHAWEWLTDGVLGTDTPFEQAHGVPYFDHLASHPDHAERFDAAMRATSQLQGELVARKLRLANVATVCDVGGGTGSILARLLARNPGLSGILAEVPSTLSRATDVLEAAGVADRVELVATDMFAAVPPGADRYLLSAVLHDWNDDAAVAILNNVRRALRPGARIWVAELELPSHDGASLERAYDLLMLTLGGGRERNRADFEKLYRAAGLLLVDDHVLANGWHVHELSAA